MSLKDSSSRSRIIEVARIKFMSSGYKATSTRMIAKEVGITQPNLYYHFKNKESLYLGVLDEIGGEVYTDLLAIVENDQLDLTGKLLQMSYYLQDNQDMDIYTMMQDMQADISSESRRILYQIFQESYKRPFILLFDDYEKQLKHQFTGEKIDTYFFVTLAPYISSKHTINKTIALEEMVELFLHGII